MLETNGGCELPCWWGITPGETDWQTVRNLFASLGKRTNDIPYPDGTVGHGTRNFEVSHSDHPEYYVAHTFVERNRVVQSTQISSEVSAYCTACGTSGYFTQDWHSYSLEQVLTRYGEPSQVRIQLIPVIEPDALPYYQLWLVYDHLGFYVMYLGLAIYEPPTMQACLRFEEVTTIALRLQVLQPDESVMESPNIPRPLEEATGMDVETFHQTFKEADNDVCLESPVDMWP